MIELSLIKEVMEKIKGPIKWIVIISGLINFLMLAQTIYMLQIFSRVLPGQGTETLLYLTLIILFALGVLGILIWIRSELLGGLSRWFQEELGPSSLEKVPDQLLLGNSYGSQCLSDLRQIGAFITGAGTLSFLDLPWSPLFILVMFILHSLLGWITLLGALGLFGIAVINERLTRPAFEFASRQNIQNQNFISKALRNADVIQSMGMMPTVIQRWAGQQKNIQNQLEYPQSCGRVLQAVTRFFRLALQVAILGTGAYLVLQQELTAGGMIAGSILLGRAVAPLENGLASWNQFLTARSAYSRIQNFLAASALRQDATIPAEPDGNLELQEIFFCFPNTSAFTLENISFQLPQGETLAIIGPSGSGKSTLARIIAGALPPVKGSARLGGMNVFHWNREQFGNYVGVLPQSIELFEGTVKENIARMKTPEDEKLVEAVSKADLQGLILRLPGGYDAQIGSDGGGLSAGIQQRIGLARALYGNPKLIILDEPNSNLDEAGLIALQKTLIQLKKEGTTVILITHLPTLLQHTDKILLLNQGKLSMYGPRDAIFRELQKHQKNKPTSS